MCWITSRSEGLHCEGYSQRIACRIGSGKGKGGGGRGDVIGGYLLGSDEDRQQGDDVDVTYKSRKHGCPQGVSDNQSEPSAMRDTAIRK